MYHRICLLAVMASLWWCMSGQAQSPSVAYRPQTEPYATFLVVQDNDDLEPEPLSPAARQAEKETVAKLRGIKDDAGRAKCFVVTEGPDKCATSVAYTGGKINDETLKLTARLCRNGTVNADKCDITDDQLKHLSGLKSLINLVLSNTPVTDKGMVHLRPLTNLQTLHLSNTKVSDPGLDDIAQLKNLKILNLSQTKVTDRGMKKLLPLTQLKWLLLSDTAITDAGLRQLAAMKQLSRVTVDKTKVTAAGVDRLKKAIPKLHVDQ